MLCTVDVTFDLEPVASTALVSWVVPPVMDNSGVYDPNKLPW